MIAGILDCLLLKERKKKQYEIIKVHVQSRKRRKKSQKKKKQMLKAGQVHEASESEVATALSRVAQASVGPPGPGCTAPTPGTPWMLPSASWASQDDHVVGV
jgi:hypothetical protein